jgi:hypothetical protein
MLRVLVGILFLGICFSQTGYSQIRKDWSFRVDPLGGAFHEMRVAIEDRFGKSDNFWYVSPYFYHRNYFKSEPQKHYGPGVRIGLRRYLFTDYSPQGIFLHASAGYRLTRIQYYDSELLITDKTFMHSPSLGFNIGRQWLYGPRMRNFAYGFMGGLEYFFNFRQSEFRNRDLPESWFQLPFSWKPQFLDGFRIYLGIEVGFAFKQKHLHW